jgi:carboxylesterase type B
MCRVNRHIGAFGGDASRITITGGSAGAGSVMNQMIMYGGEANPPFQAALAGKLLGFDRLSTKADNNLSEYPWWQPYHDSYVQERQYSVLLGQANCSDIVCLRSISEAALLQAYQTSYAVGYAAGQYGYGDYWYGPLVDGNIIRDLPSAEFLRGHFTKVPLLVDHEGYEGYGFTNKSLNTTAEGAADLATLWPNAGKSFFERLYQLYPSSAFNSTIFQVQQIFGDAFISCPTYYMSTAAVDHDVPVWKLNFRAGAETHGSTYPPVTTLGHCN